jgi:hypothetical protein
MFYGTPGRIRTPLAAALRWLSLLLDSHLPDTKQAMKIVVKFIA